MMASDWVDRKIGRVALFALAQMPVDRFGLDPLEIECNPDAKRGRRAEIAVKTHHHLR